MMAPIASLLASKEGRVTEELAGRYVLCGQGGAGIIVIGGASVRQQKALPVLCLNADRSVSPLKDLTHRIHGETASKIAIQLVHYLNVGRREQPRRVEELSLKEVWTIPRSFAKAAYRARTAGFDAVELHFAHAHTVSSFLSRSNVRNDRYGGSLEKRLRLAEEVLQKARKEVGTDYVIGAVMNGDEFCITGNTLKQSRIIALRLAELGLDYLRVSDGGRFDDRIPRKGKAMNLYADYSENRAVPPNWMPEKVNVHLCANLKATLNGAGHETTMITAGRIPTATVAEEILESGEADMVAIGRPILCDPFWVKKSKEGREKDIQKCRYCNECRERGVHFEKVYCAQWRRENGTYEPPPF
jgi:2,4-dienoyl-CoA reductase-like NADH-dependent reductase (Old Yellow Enzyme family)